MSEFEFVIVVFAIILGLSISEILAGWADQIRARKRLHAYPLQLFSTGYILFFSLNFIWLLWLFRDIEWTFAIFLVVAFPALLVALASRVGKADTTADAPSLRDQYFKSSAPVYCLLALMLPIVISVSFFTDLRAALPDPPNLIFVTLVRVLMIFLFIGLALSKNERFHWFALGFIWLAQIWFLVRLGESLSNMAA